MHVRPRCFVTAPAVVGVVALLLVAHAASAFASASKPAVQRAFSVEHAITLKLVQGPTWSRDGKAIAFVVNAPDTAENTTNQDVWLWDATSDSCRALTHNPKNDYGPQFSPGGDTLAFLSPRDSDEGMCHDMQW